MVREPVEASYGVALMITKEGLAMLREYVQRPLPPGLEALQEMSLDLRLSGSQFTERLWELLDAEAWERVANPHMVLQNCPQEKLDALATDPTVRSELAARIDRWRTYLTSTGWFDAQPDSAALRTVAYFSMEFGLSEALPIYSGGLGILAGDHLKSASDLNVPLIGIGLLYQQGYFRQVLADDGWQLQALPFNDPGTLPIRPVLDKDRRWPLVRLELPGRTLCLRVWHAQVGRVSLYLLDSNHPLNTPWDRAITATLYAAGKETRLLQELVLGVGGWRLLEQLGIDVSVCHLNEGHAAFAILARAASFARQHHVPFPVAMWVTRAGNVFTTHTPVEAAFDQFDAELLCKYAQPFADAVGISLEEVLAMGRKEPRDGQEPFNMAYLAMRGAGRINGVSRLHGEVSRRLFSRLFPDWPEREVPVGHITNGVHIPSWDSGPANQVWQAVYSGPGNWFDHLETAVADLDRATDEPLWNFRAMARQKLVKYVRQRLLRQLQVRGATDEALRRARHVLDPNWLTLGFARRFTAYKRPNLLLQDPERFARLLLNAERPVQFIVAGKAHPNDEYGKAMVQAMAQFAWREPLRDRVIFLEDYDMTLAQHFATGIDVWLNNPRRPAEACGTSGMKMIANGGLHISTLDGWWAEAYSPELGFEIGGGIEHGGEHDAWEAEALYTLLEQQVVPEFYQRDTSGIPRNWVRRIRHSMQTLTAQYSSDRMVREYVQSAYFPAAAAFDRRAAEKAALAFDLNTWQQHLRENWNSARFGQIEVTANEAHWHYSVQVYFGDLKPDTVHVQLYVEPSDGEASRPIVMDCEGPILGAVNAFQFHAVVPADRPAEHYTARLVAAHPFASIPLEEMAILWAH
jgi:starch phosphorylase